MKTQLSVIEATNYVNKIMAEIKETEKEISDHVNDLTKANKKGKLGDVRHYNHLIKLVFERKDNLESYLDRAKKQVVRSKRIESGYQVIVEFLEEILLKDIEWHQELIADYKEKGYKGYGEMLKTNKITKTDYAFARMSAGEARRIFEQDLDMRFNRLIKQLNDKVGEIKEIKLRRNENLGLDGYVVGEKATANLNTIIAGGYNVQRLHYRTLVKVTERN